jgi:phosphoribosylformimino-5-aminoimidazole carboxamide ribotide isomerase
MIIIPAIDLKGGKCVRLTQGRRDAEFVYSEDPVAMAQQWEEAGAPYLHIVDLDGAFQGHPVHADIIARIANRVTIPFEVGGGLRKDEDIQAVVDSGADRVIIGTRAVDEPDSLRRLLDRFGAQIAVGIDARNGMVQVQGWVKTTSTMALDLGRTVDGMGARTIIYTDTEVDGTLGGANAKAMAEMCSTVECNVVASGGIASAGDVSRLVQLCGANLHGVIVGKALYEGSVTYEGLTAVL